MEKLVIATKNKHKIEEFKAMLGKTFKILSLEDIGFNEEIDENGQTCSENAKIKAQAVMDFVKKIALKDFTQY